MSYLGRLYVKENEQERRPNSGNFAPGEFTKIFQQVLDTVDLIFQDGVNWKAFTYALERVKNQHGGAKLAVQSLENKDDGIVIVKLRVSPDADKTTIHSAFLQGYEFAYNILEDQYQANLNEKNTLIASQNTQIALYNQEKQSKGEYINKLFSILEQEKEVQKLMAEVSKSSSGVSLHPNQLKILQAINDGLCDDGEIAEAVEVPIDIVEYYVQQLRQEGYLNQPTFDGYSLTSQGKVAATNPELLLPINRTPTHQTTINASHATIGFIQSGSGTISSFSQNISQNVDEISNLINSLRNASQVLPEVEREEALMHLDDLRNDINQLEKRTPTRIKARIIALWAVACTLGVGIAGATDFSNNVLELAEKLGVSIEFSQPQPMQPLPPSK